jgi:hypothetical protein
MSFHSQYKIDLNREPSTADVEALAQAVQYNWNALAFGLFSEMDNFAWFMKGIYQQWLKVANEYSFPGFINLLWAETTAELLEKKGEQVVANFKKLLLDTAVSLDKWRATLPPPKPFKLLDKITIPRFSKEAEAKLASLPDLREILSTPDPGLGQTLVDHMKSLDDEENK